MPDVRLIDANVLPNYKCQVTATIGDRKGPAEMRFVFWQDIEKAPTIDAVPVVRCRECVYYQPKDAMTPGKNRMRCNHPCLDYDIECYDQWLDVEPDDYCKHGKRKT